MDISQVQENCQDGWVVNPNKKVVNGIIKGINRNNGECPCKNDSVDKRCPCSNYRDNGKCCCGLYVKDAKSNDKKKACESLEELNRTIQRLKDEISEETKKSEALSKELEQTQAVLSLNSKERERLQKEVDDFAEARNKLLSDTSMLESKIETIKALSLSDRIFNWKRLMSYL